MADSCLDLTENNKILKAIILWLKNQIKKKNGSGKVSKWVCQWWLKKRELTWTQTGSEGKKMKGQGREKGREREIGCRGKKGERDESKDIYGFKQNSKKKDTEEAGWNVNRK